MSFENNADLNQTAAAPVAAAPVPLTKEQKLAKIDEQIAKLQAKRSDIENDVVRVKAAKEVVVPVVGDTVTFMFGRKTATTAPSEKIGTVIGVKAASTLANGKTAPAQVKVQFGEGFDAETAVIYPAQVTSISKPEAADIA
jgi:hypothetical protein